MFAPWRPFLERALLKAWAHRSVASIGLLPISAVYWVLSHARRAMFRWRFFPVHRANSFVIVIGNVVVGGGGKTPTVISVARYLSAKGYAVGIVSRGFGRSTRECQEVFATSPPQDVGDEPVLIKGATQLPVFVSRHRYEAVNALLTQYPATQIVVCDDGLQHYSLYRDLEVCVFDERGCGNHFLLPAGPLREAWPRKALKLAGQHADKLLVLHTGNTRAFPGYRALRSLSPRGLRADGTSVELLKLTEPGMPPLMALAGIAQPQNFFSMLRATGLPLAQTLALPDHYSFDHLAPQLAHSHQLLCTEKDAVKLWSKVSSAIAVELIQTIEPAFFIRLDEYLSAQGLTPKELKPTDTPLSSHHGHQTS